MRRKGRDKVRAATYARDYRAKYHAKVRGYDQKYKQGLRLRLIELLGGKCAHCNNADERVLTFDHINGDGWKERKRSDRPLTWDGRGNVNYNKWLQAPDETRKKVQLLCANCHMIKTRENKENNPRKPRAELNAAAQTLPLFQ